jgi:hypothetical protein
MLNVIILNVIMLKPPILKVTILNVTLLNLVMLNANAECLGTNSIHSNAQKFGLTMGAFRH